MAWQKKKNGSEMPSLPSCHPKKDKKKKRKAMEKWKNRKGEQDSEKVIIAI